MKFFSKKRDGEAGVGIQDLRNWKVTPPFPLRENIPPWQGGNFLKPPAKGAAKVELKKLKVMAEQGSVSRFAKRESNPPFREIN